ncbi:gfo/Idh/MocA family oxidoreductase [candidate division KSB1 bacterium]|nr:Gfo/Idh/MocA family oxidoreductase [candidate division KSB1 bacterium]RQW05621.1 MAG: gfo/Idh/MocA family oxidoreductase [candidate division KSB1 bacterium]
MNRRKFIGSTAATAATISIVPRHVLGGAGFIPPSDKITVANIGCGTQGLREMPGMLENPEIQVVAVCDPNKFTTDYLDWSPNGIRNLIRTTLEDPEWGAQYQGIPGGRDIGKEFVEKYYAKNMPSGAYKGCSSYEDYRELLEKEKDVDAIKIMAPDHHHAYLAIAAMKKGKHVITHKPIANRISEGKLAIDLAKKAHVKTHLLAWSEKPEYDLILQWIENGVIGTLQEIHNWSHRPVWEQWPSRPKERPPIPDGFNWKLWLGPVPDLPYHPHYTHNVFRGWYDFGGGSIADMGHYSLFPLFRTFGIDTPPIGAKAYGTTHRYVDGNTYKWIENDVSFPLSSLIQLNFPKQKKLPAFDLFWYDGGMKPFIPEELKEDNRDITDEGMMFVGDKGKILAGFSGEHPEIIPARRMHAYQGEKELPERERGRRSDTWAAAIKNDKESPGSFIYAGTVTEAINLAAVALRTGKKVDYDSANMKITNDETANAYLTREYREGWEL